MQLKLTARLVVNRCGQARFSQPPLLSPQHPTLIETLLLVQRAVHIVAAFFSHMTRIVTDKYRAVPKRSYYLGRFLGSDTKRCVERKASGPRSEEHTSELQSHH